FATPEARRPVLRFPNELPIAGEPSDVYSKMEQPHRALGQSSYPKLIIVGNPVSLVPPDFSETVAKRLKDCKDIQLRTGSHYGQEDHGGVIGTTVKEWLIDLENQ